MNATFWKGKKVFVTGHTGFKGSWLSIWLNLMEAKVTGYALAPNTTPNLFEAASVAQRMNSQLGDVRDLGGLTSAIQRSAPEIVFHLAAQPLVRYGYDHPVETYATNVMGTVNLLEAVRHQPSVKAVVIVTTDKCYQNNEWYWAYRENEALGGHDPYSNSKACSELVSAAYRASYFSKPSQHLSLGTARAGNVIGGGDWSADRLVPDVLKAIENQKPILIRNPNAVRPWQHVLEPLCGYLMLAQSLYERGQSFAQPWNFGPHDTDSKTVQWIVNKLSDMTNHGHGIETQPGEHPHEARYLKLDISKAQAELNWRPVLSLQQALELIVDWQQSFNKNVNPLEICTEQISHYQKLFTNTLR